MDFCRYMFGLAAIPSVVRFVAFFFLPESPRWLVGRGRSEAARAVLRRVRGGEAEQVEEELRQIQENLQHSAEKNRQGELVIGLLGDCRLRSLFIAMQVINLLPATVVRSKVALCTLCMVVFAVCIQSLLSTCTNTGISMVLQFCTCIPPTQVCSVSCGPS